MELPFFFTEVTGDADTSIVLDENSSRHIVQSLRMHSGDPIVLTNGKGLLLRCTIRDADKKKCRVRVDNIDNRIRETKNLTIAISLLKNISRFEWFLEKATELGVSLIIPLICERTE